MSVRQEIPHKVAPPYVFLLLFERAKKIFKLFFSETDMIPLRDLIRGWRLASHYAKQTNSKEYEIRYEKDSVQKFWEKIPEIPS
jgi:hypothetical protein